MQAVSFSELRKDMKHIIDMIKDRHEPTIITRKQGNMVMMSLEDYNALDETAYILSDPTNAQHVLSSPAELRAGKGQERKLVEPQS
ncbi:type II toxin-antitoxin system Phd/YefM family antitoxin [Candidatus Paracaedibacter symbiosus]|uniref:type II toxin-antitoxin system Phd/YefM family antitoxin n=1 Tax=Candidatus Paracaedibacter symbiosus TaxID=244582 RepID=UPI000509A59E|nr:type II toxin-antitoxin system Phd/YefM family antitoxin [Candidatus Paracaedibacter symbiosus]